MTQVSERMLQLEELGKRHPKFLKGAVLLAGTAAFNHIGGEIVSRSGPNEIFRRPYDGQYRRTVGVVFPGFGSSGGESMAQQMEKTPLGKQQWFFCRYDNKRGTNNEIFAKQLKSMQQELGFEGIDAYSPSMGFIHNLEIARLSGIPIRNVLLSGTPSHLRDARAGWLGHMIAQYFPYDGGLGAKFTSTLIANTVRYGLKKTHYNFSNAVGETFRGASTTLLRSQMITLGSIDILKNWNEYREVIIPGYTKPYYAASLDNSDRIVYTAQAYTGIVQFFGKFNGIQVPFIELPQGAGHADTALTIAKSIPWLEQAYQNTENVVFDSRSIKLL